MRNNFLIFLIVLSPMFVSGQLTFTTGVEYNDYIVEQQTNVGNAINNLMNSMDLDSASVWYYYNTGLEATKVSLDNIQRMPVFNNNANFKNASQELFQYYFDVFSVEFKEFVKIYTNTSIPYDKKMELLNPLLETIGTREVTFDGNFAKAQQEFATENNFDLIVPEPEEGE